MSSDEVMAGTTVVMTHSQRQAFLKTSHLGQLLGVANLLPEVEEVTEIKYAPTSEAKEAAILSVNEKTFNEKTFQEQVLQSPIPVLVSFSTPRRTRLDSIIDSLFLKFKADYGDKIKLVTVKADKNFKLFTVYRLKKPTLLLIKDGIVQQRLSLEGLRGKQDLREIIEEIQRCINAG